MVKNTKMPAAVFLQYYLYIPQSGSVVAPRIFHFLAELGTACHHGAEQVALMMPWTLGLIGSVMSVIGRGDDPLEPKVLSHAGERVGERLGRHRVLSRPTRQEGETLGISMHVQRDRAVEPEQQRRGPEHGGVRPLALGFDAEVRADFLVRGLHGSTAVEAVEDVTSVGLRIRAQDGLVVTSVPKVPIWKACEINALHCIWHINALISLEIQLFVSTRSFWTAKNASCSKLDRHSFRHLVA